MAAKGTGKAAKGLPKRSGNQNLKARRAASWARTQLKKRKRQELQEVAHKRNRSLRQEGKLTPWQAAKQRAQEKKAKLRKVKETVGTSAN